ncbi:hypothetical protein [Chitinophaga vietnamensis]|uniref:hypothetical protein n=1 Tax=Chitinophaga vietnamensis TaxID=2593957 RepID=UPI001177F720|nr:hypothetical protein [Chitinophaga vietnamensis]
MKFRFLCSSLLAGVASMISMQLYAQQLKLGANPYQLSKDALLELNSNNQGLLMPRVTKAQLLSGGNLFSSVDGMFVFVDDATEKSLYLKKNGAWTKVADFGNITAGTGISITNGTIANTGVTSFNTRTGDIIPATGDYAAFYAPLGRKLTISAGTGITAATTVTQDLSADRTFTINADNTNALWNANQLQGKSIATTVPNINDVLTYNGTSWTPKAPASAGSVTSVGLSLPNIFTVTNSPVTTTGTLTGTLATQAANTFFAGPTSGVNAAPAFRTLVAADIPNKISIVPGSGVMAMNPAITQNLSANPSWTISVDSSKSIWNANKLQSRSVLDSVPGDGDVLKWSAARNMFLPGQTMAGGASYGNMTSTDPATADAPDPLYRMKIWRGPWGKVNSSGAVSLNTGPTGAFAWSILAFQYNLGSNQFTTQLYFDKNTLALKEWAGIAQPLTDNPSNPWYKVVTTLGSNVFTNGGLMFANQTYDATTEVAQDASNLYWDSGNRKLGIRNNTPTATLDVNGSVAYNIRTVTGSTTLADDDYTVLVSGNTTITLPTPDATNQGRVYIIKRIGTNTVTISGTLFDTANATSLTIGTVGAKYVLQSNGSRWYTIN